MGTRVVDPALRALTRDRERITEIKRSLLVCSSKLSLPLYLIFWLADLVYAPNQIWTFLGLRLFIIPLCLITNVLTDGTSSLTGTQIIGSVFIFVNGFLISYMTYLTDGISSPYYAGLCLVSIGAMTFIPWTTRFLIANLLLIFAPYYVLGLFFSKHGAIEGGLLNSFFIGGTVIITIAIRLFNENLRMREIESRLLLEEELRSRERIIKEKTIEATRLSALTKQFSPQVVYAIQSGQIRDLNVVQRARICALFVDIVNSTERMVKVDKESFKEALAMFMEDTMKTLLKYDITIDKFLGDGILAFSNAPMNHSDYIGRAMEATIEVRKRISLRSGEYGRHWPGDFQIRAGISEGWANVGFFGSDECFRTYTAIGVVMNMASRLCAIAGPGRIVTNSQTMHEVSADLFEFTNVGEYTLRGFGGEKVSVFEIDSAGKSGRIYDVQSCPNGHGILHLHTDLMGIYTFQCRQCGYVHKDGAEIKKAA